MIDPATDIAYMTHKAYASGELGPSSTGWTRSNWRHGHEKAGFPVELGRTAQNAPGTTFTPRTQLQRPGLLLLEGIVYAAFGSDCDADPFQGWVFGVTESGTVKARWTTETDYSGAGIWQSGAGLTSDGPGTILFSTGNGADAARPYTRQRTARQRSASPSCACASRRNGELKATDFFAPYDAPRSPPGTPTSPPAG